jgi:hypothetical protein
MVDSRYEAESRDQDSAANDSDKAQSRDHADSEKHRVPDSDGAPHRATMKERLEHFTVRIPTSPDRARQQWPGSGPS